MFGGNILKYDSFRTAFTRFTENIQSRFNGV